MSDGTSYALAAPTAENFEGRLAPEQQHWFEKALIREYVHVLLAPIMIFGYVTVWQGIRLWRCRIDSEWLLFVSLNLVPLLVLLLLLLWIEWRYYPRMPHVNRMRRELQRGTVVQGEGELLWHDHTYAPVVGERTLFAFDATVRDVLPGRYRLFYLPETGLLVAAEPLGKPVPQRDLLISLAYAQGFYAGTLAANRAGETRKERMEVQNSDTALIALLSVFAGVFLIMLVLAAFMLAGPVCRIAMVNGFGTLVGALITLVLAIPMLIALPVIDSRRILRLWFSTTRDGRHARAVEGMARKRVRDVDYPPVYTIEVGGRQSAVHKATYSAIDTSLPYRVYYLPRGNRLLSMEPLAIQSAQEAV